MAGFLLSLAFVINKLIRTVLITDETPGQTTVCCVDFGSWQGARRAHILEDL
jgi:hypothetical protein